MPTSSDSQSPPPPTSPEVLDAGTRLRERRQQLRMAQATLAERALISRQSLYAIEVGRTQPSVLVAIRLAQALETTVEALFATDPPLVALPAAPVASGARVVLGRFDAGWVAHPIDRREIVGAHRAADAVVARHLDSGMVEVRRLKEALLPKESVLVAGCAPGLAVVADRLSSVSSHYHWISASSSRSLELLREGTVHIAGMHFADPRTNRSNAQFIAERMPERDIVLFNLAVWDEGFAISPGNPLGIREGADLLRPEVRSVWREPGAAARLVQERLAAEAGGDPAALVAKSATARSHFEVGLLIASGVADTGVTARLAAMAYGLDFVPIQEERFDLAVPLKLAEQPSIGRLLDALKTPGLRRELSALGGYGTSQTGQLTAELRTKSKGTFP